MAMIYIYICTYIWVNYNDLTATSLESWLVRGIIPKWPYFRLVNYFNLPRYIPKSPKAVLFESMPRFYGRGFIAMLLDSTAEGL